MIWYDIISQYTICYDVIRYIIVRYMLYMYTDTLMSQVYHTRNAICLCMILLYSSYTRINASMRTCTHHARRASRHPCLHASMYLCMDGGVYPPWVIATFVTSFKVHLDALRGSIRWCKASSGSYQLHSKRRPERVPQGSNVLRQVSFQSAASLRWLPGCRRAWSDLTCTNELWKKQYICIHRRYESFDTFCVHVETTSE